MIAVTSSTIAEMGHVAVENVLFVKFKNGTTYKYSNVGAALFEQILLAESVGSAFSNLIKKNPDLYPYSKV